MTAPVTLGEWKARLIALAEDAPKLALHAEAQVLWSLNSYFQTEQTKAKEQVEALMKAAGQ